MSATSRFAGDRGARGHRNVTHSRNQKDTAGHQRTRRPPRLSTGGHSRKRRDTGGHELRWVRDREAPGSNPGPPTKFRIRNRVKKEVLTPTLTPTGEGWLWKKKAAREAQAACVGLGWRPYGASSSSITRAASFCMVGTTWL